MSTSVASTLNCDDVEESLGAYALGILELEEHRDIQRHLESCSNCSAAVVKMEHVVDSLASAPAPISPPSSLRDRLLAETMPPVELDKLPTAIPIKRKNGSSLTIPRWSVWPVAAAAILLLAGIATLSVLLLRANDKVDSAEAAQRQLASYLSAGGQAVKLSATTVIPGGTYAGHGTFVTAPNMPPILVVSGCPPSGKERRYRVWLAKAGDRTGVADLVVDSKGNGWVQIESAETLTNFDTVGVTMIDANDQRQDWLAGVLTPTSSA